MKILVLDNYDSFAYNQAQAFQKEGCEVEVKRNDALTVGQIRERDYDAIVISSGPGHPANKRDMGVCNEVILQLNDIPLLGICLGHQAIIHLLGGKVVCAPKPMHGKNSLIRHDGDALFDGMLNPFSATRYHSLVGEMASLPKELEALAFSQDDGQLMAVKHRSRILYGVQFHPEAILTKNGQKIIRNFLRIARR